MKLDKQLTKEEILQIPELIKVMTLKEISVKFDCHYNTIRSWIYKLRKNGYKIEIKKGRKGLLEKLAENNN
jgi:transposase